MSVLVRPIITEKSQMLTDKEGQYSFEVDMNANKVSVKTAIEGHYPGVEVINVRTMIMPSKPAGRFTRGGFINGRTKRWKKAIVTLKEGQEIDFFEEV